MGKEQNLTADFSKFDFCSDSVSRLQGIVTDLYEFEKNQKLSMPTALQKINRFKAIETMSRGISKEVKALDSGSYLWLDTELARLDYRYRVTVAETSLGSHVAYMDQVALHFAEAAKNAAKEMQDREAVMGRKGVLGAYAGFIAAVAVVTKLENIKPGRGGKFEDVCSLVFSAASVPAKPEGAIKHFLKAMHADYKERGHCL